RTDEAGKRRARAADGIPEHPGDGQIAERRHPDVVAAEVLDVPRLGDPRRVSAAVRVLEADRAVLDVALIEIANVIGTLDPVVALAVRVAAPPGALAGLEDADSMLTLRLRGRRSDHAQHARDCHGDARDP